ncbi:hypothetical protein ACFXKG_20885 [Streptomyces sp. NPDC059255]
MASTGSIAGGRPDVHSDVDLILVIDDETTRRTTWSCGSGLY